MKTKDAFAEIAAHLGSAVTQSLPEDDQIIMGHVRDALKIARDFAFPAAADPAPLALSEEVMKTLEAAASLRPTFPSMWLANIREAMHRAGMPRPENHHTTATGSAIYFTDPEDGQRYRITVEPIKPEAEPKF